MTDIPPKHICVGHFFSISLLFSVEMKLSSSNCEFSVGGTTCLSSFFKADSKEDTGVDDLTDFRVGRIGDRVAGDDTSRASCRAPGAYPSRSGLAPKVDNLLLINSILSSAPELVVKTDGEEPEPFVVVVVVCSLILRNPVLRSDPIESSEFTDPFEDDVDECWLFKSRVDPVVIERRHK